MIFILDVTFNIFRAIEDDYGLHTSISTIFQVRVRTFSFHFDLISAFPAQIFMIMITTKVYDRLHCVFYINRILKIHKVINFFFLLLKSNF